MGYSVRLDRRASQNTRLVFCTTGKHRPECGQAGDFDGAEAGEWQCCRCLRPPLWNQLPQLACFCIMCLGNLLRAPYWLPAVEVTEPAMGKVDVICPSLQEPIQQTSRQLGFSCLPACPAEALLSHLVLDAPAWPAAALPHRLMHIIPVCPAEALLLACLLDWPPPALQGSSCGASWGTPSCRESPTLWSMRFMSAAWTLTSCCSCCATLFRLGLPQGATLASRSSSCPPQQMQSCLRSILQGPVRWVLRGAIGWSSEPLSSNWFSTGST